MAFAFQRPDSPYWWLSLRPAGKRIKLPTQTPLTGADKAQMDGVAAHVEDLFARAEQDVSAALELRRMGIKPPAERKRLARKAGRFEAPVVSIRPTILDVAASHPASKREQKRPREYDAHVRAVQDFVAFAGIMHLDEMRQSHVANWVAKLEEDYAPATIRGKLLWVRRAAAMGPEHGLPNVMQSFRLQQSDPGEVLALSREQLVATMTRLRLAPMAFAAAGLMGCMGLRPSECVRVQSEDFEDGDKGPVLRVGSNDRKNAQSRRSLPIPAVLWRCIRPLLGSPGKLFVLPNLSPGRYVRDTTGELSRLITPLLKPTVEWLTPKHLRKTFATVSIYDLGLAGPLVDAFMGHKPSGFSVLSQRHYVARAQVELLRPISESWNTLLLECHVPP